MYGGGRARGGDGGRIGDRWIQKIGGEREGERMRQLEQEREKGEERHSMAAGGGREWRGRGSAETPMGVEARSKRMREAIVGFGIFI
jgi:hypothetical protein